MLVAAVEHAFVDGIRVPYEMGGTAGTSDIANTVIQCVTTGGIHEIAETGKLG